MFDQYTNTSGELRHLAFRKSSAQATWQDAIRQKNVNGIEYRLGKYRNDNFMANFARTLAFQVNQWRRAHHQASTLMTNLPSRNKAG